MTKAAPIEAPARIASLLPSATEIVCALGLQDRLVGVTHECDHPEGVAALPHLTSNLLAEGLSSEQIDRAVRTSLRGDAHTIYALDAERLRALDPQVVVTQELCEICAVPTSAVADAVCTMPREARVVSLDPLGLDDVFATIEQAGQALGVAGRGRALAASLRAKVEAIRAAVEAERRPTVLSAEWLDPVYCGGHWLPEMIAAAGGADAFGAAREPSQRVPWEQVLAADPDAVVLMPCGYAATEVVERYAEIAAAPEWERLRAVREGRVYAVDASSYFSRPGPRLVEGVRILARILHPGADLEALPERAAYHLQGGRIEAVR